MHFKSLQVICIFFLFINYCAAQPYSNDKVIKEITFDGLKKTKAQSLLNNILSKDNQIFDKRSLDADLQRLKNLASVANAKMSIDSSEKEVFVNFSIDERRTALPLVNFGGIEGNIWFSIGVIENNFRGVGDQAFVNYQNNDGRHSMQAYYKKPRLMDRNWGYSVSLNKWSSLEPLYFSEGSVDYLYDNNGIGLSYINNINFNNSFELGGTYFVEKYTQAVEQNLDNPPGPKEFTTNKFLTKVELKQNHLAYNFFYLTGHEVFITYQNVFNFFDASLFNSVIFQSKLFFRPKKKLNIGARFRFGISTNNDSPFAPFVADSHVNLRGIGNRIDRGTAQGVFNLELRHTAYHKKYWSTQLVAFTDAGTWRSPGGSLADLLNRDQFRQFIGGGVRIIYQKIYGAILRIDYGIDIYDPKRKGLVIGLGQYF